MKDTAWDREGGEEVIDYFHREFIEKHLKPGMVVAEFGIAGGSQARYMVSKKAKVYGIDYLEGCVNKFSYHGTAILKDLDENMDFDIVNIPDNSLDIVFIFEVLEHLRCPEYTVHLINRKLKPGGLVVASTPNSAWLGIRLKVLFGGCMEDTTNTNHVRFFNMKHFKKLFEDRGFVTVEHVTDTVIPNLPRRLPWTINATPKPRPLLGRDQVYTGRKNK